MREEDRVDAVRALVLSRDAWVPDPKTWTGALVATSAKRGELATRTVNCTGCGGSNKPRNLERGRGQVKRGRHTVNCVACGGSNEPGHEHAGAGVIVVDGYTGQQAATVAASSRRTVLCDSCGGLRRLSAYSRAEPSRDAPLCDRCEGTGRLEVSFTWWTGEDADAPGGWLIAEADEQRTRLYDRGDYRALDEALAELAIRDTAAYARLTSILRSVDCGTPLAGRTEQRFQEILEQLAGLMPAEIRVPAEHRPQRRRFSGNGRDANGYAQGQRNERIRALYQSGLSQTKIALEIGVTRQRVQQILTLGGLSVLGGVPIASGRA